MGFADSMAWDAPRPPSRRSGDPAPVTYSPQEQAADEAYDRTPGNLANLDGEIAKASTPQIKAILTAERSRITNSTDTVSGPFAGAMTWGDAPIAKAPEAPKPPAQTTPKAPARGFDLAKSPVADTIGTLATGIGSSILGGLHGAYKILTGEGPEAAANAVTAMQEAGTHQPVSEGGKAAVGALASPLNPLNWPSVGAKYLAEKASEKGISGSVPAAIAAGLESAAAVATPGLLLKGAKGTNAAAQTGLKTLKEAAPITLPANIDTPTIIRRQSGATPLSDITNPKPVEPIVAPEPAKYGSAVASATSNAAALKAELEQATPELRAEFDKLKPGERLHETAAANQLDADRLPVPMRLTKAQALGDVVSLSEEFNAKAKDGGRIGAKYGEQGAELHKNMEAIRDKAAPDVFGTDHVQNGRTLIEGYQATDKALQADITAKYKALKDANGGQFPIDAKVFAENAEAALHKELKSDYLAAPIKAQLERFKNGEPMTFEQFETLRTNLATDMRTGKGNEAAAAHVVRQALEELPLPPHLAKLKEVADSARGAARARFQLIEKDPAYKAVVEGKASPDEFIQKYVVGGKVDNVKTMVEHLGNGSLEHQTMAAGVINYLTKKAGSEFSQSNYNRGLKEVSPDGKLLAIVGPDAAAQLERVGRVAELTQKIGRGNYANRSHSAVVADHMKNTAEHAANAVIGAKTGIPGGSMVRSIFAKRADAKFVNEALQTGAGIRLKDIGK